MMRFPRAATEETGPALTSDLSQQQIASHVTNIPELGDVLFHHAHGLNVGKITVNDGDDRILLQLASRGCQCGCGAPGRGLFVTPPADHARHIGERLIELADEMEASAAAAANDLLRKAAGK